MSVLVGDFLSGIALLSVFAIPAIWYSRNYWRDLFAELTHAWRDVTRPIP